MAIITYVEILLRNFRTTDLKIFKDVIEQFCV